MSQVTTLTTKGQATIPKEIRDKLGLKPGDKIRFTLENGHAVLRRAYPSLEEVMASLPPLNMDISVEEAIELAKEERARELLAKMQSR